jgi:hypothetical protein
MSTNDANGEVLIVTDTALAAGPLVRVVRESAEAGRREFTLLIPATVHGLHRVVDPEDQCCAEAERTTRALRPALEAAAGGPMRIVIGSHDRMAAIQDAANAHHFGEVILATRSNRVARWARLDLASKVRALGVPLRAVRVGPRATAAT